MGLHGVYVLVVKSLHEAYMGAFSAVIALYGQFGR